MDTMNRRTFLQTSASAATTMAFGGCAVKDHRMKWESERSNRRPPGAIFVDVHCHVGQRARPCQKHDRFSFEQASTYAPYDAYMSDPIYKSLSGAIARSYFGVRSGWTEQQADAHIEAKLLEHILGATRVDRVVIVALDQYHRDDGTPVGLRRRGEPLGSDLYVSNTYARQLSRQYPHRILFGASIHPYRASAARMLDEVAEAGAVLIKWVPVAQNIDAEDPRTVAFMRRAAEIGMPMLIHYGGERALDNMHPEFEDPSGLLRTLRRLRREGTMPTVIVAHVATPATWPVGPGPHFWIMVDALRGEFAHDPLYADLAALAVFNRTRWLKFVAGMPSIRHKLVYGSDFPLPPAVSSFRLQLASQYRQVAAISNWIDQDIAIKTRLGLGEEVLARGGKLLEKRIHKTA